MLTTIAAAWRLHSVLDSVLWGRCGNAVATLWGLIERHGRVVGAPRAPVKRPCISRIWTAFAMHFDNNIRTGNHEMYLIIITIMDTNETIILVL